MTCIHGDTGCSHRRFLPQDYFGEKVGLYYLLLTHYTTWLLSAAIVGIGIYVHVALQDGDPNVWSVPIFCAFIAIWTT